MSADYDRLAETPARRITLARLLTDNHGLLRDGKYQAVADAIIAADLDQQPLRPSERLDETITLPSYQIDAWAPDAADALDEAARELDTASYRSAAALVRAMAAKKVQP